MPRTGGQFRNVATDSEFSQEHYPRHGMEGAPRILHVTNVRIAFNKDCTARNISEWVDSVNRESLEALTFPRHHDHTV